MISTSFRKILPLLVLLIASGCGEDDEQREFEQQAFQLPDAITETDFNGEILNEDSDDWRISPYYSGLVFLEPVPHPNPVSLSNNFNITVNSPYQDGINFLEIVILGEDGNYTFRHTQSFDVFEVIGLDPTNFGRFQSLESARGLHRVIIFDGNGNIISYGDVEVVD